jgi:hypothetical protein
MSAKLEDFFTSPEADRLHEKELLRKIIVDIPLDSPDLYELTFHAAFAKRIFDILKREGGNIQGAERMQQSFRDSVEKVRTILVPYEARNLSTTILNSSTPEARAMLSRLVEDLALVKNWLMRHEAR